MATITTTDLFYGLGPGDWRESRYGDRQSFQGYARVREDDGTRGAGVLVSLDGAGDGAWGVELQAREVVIQGTTTPGTRTQSGGREGQAITLDSVLDVDPASLPTDPATNMPYTADFDVPLQIVLTTYAPWTSGTRYTRGTPVQYENPGTNMRQIWRCTMDHTAAANGANGPPSVGTHWELDPRVGRFDFLTPMTRQLNPALGATQLPGLIVWLVMSQGDVVINRVLYGVLFRPGPRQEA